MSSRLNAWYRLGIVLTVFWMLGGTFWMYSASMGQRMHFATQLDQFCLDGYDRLQAQYPTLDYSKERAGCGKNMMEYLDHETPEIQVLGLCLGIAAVLASLAWGLIGLTTNVIRWILAGRKTSDTL